MTDERTTFSTKPFITYDGEDPQGIRAEVKVHVGTAKVAAIEEKTRTAKVVFKIEGLKYDTQGYVLKDTEAFAAAKAAYESGEPVSFRIEKQRKKDVDRALPYAEIGSDTDSARENTIAVLVAVNGHFTEEAVTNPDEDPAAGGRHSAFGKPVVNAGAASGHGGSAPVAGASKEELLARLTELAKSPLARQPILDTLSGHALAAGATPEEVVAAANASTDRRSSENPHPDGPRSSFAVENPAWKEYNSDGRLNLGSSVISAAVGAETLVNRYLVQKGWAEVSNRDEVVLYFTNLILTLADFVQKMAYGEGATPDRGASSHTRVRGIIYDIVENHRHLPLEVKDGNLVVIGNGQASLTEWYKTVGAEAKTRFQTAIRASQTYQPLNAAAPASLLGQVAQQPPVAQTPSPTSAPAPAAEAPAAPQEVPAPVVETPAQAPAEKSSRAALAQQIVNEVSENPSYDYDLSGAAVPDEVAGGTEYPQFPASDVADPEQLADEDAVNSYMDLISSAGFDKNDRADQQRLAKFNNFTFGGISSIRKVPLEALVNAVDHYAAMGDEYLQQAVAHALESSE